MNHPRQLLEDLEPHLDSLNTWELEFIENITTRVAAKEELTEKQLMKLEQIVERFVR